MELPKPARKSSREGLGVVLVMGMTGAGKSTLISRLKTAGNQVQIGHGLESKTTDLAVYEASTPGNPSRRVLLADTPGFNDTVRSDADVLHSIVTPLYDLQRKGHPVLGILYLHNISNTRLSGTALRMLKVLQQFCGQVNFHRVVFVTTMWEDANFTPHGGRAAYQRHQALQREFWDDMFAGNGGVVRHLRDHRESAGNILDYFFDVFCSLKKPDQERPLRVLDEMTHGRSVEQTSAYQCVHEEQRLLRKRKEQQLARLEEQRRGLQSECRIESAGEGLEYGSIYAVSSESGAQPSLRRMFSGFWRQVTFSKERISDQVDKKARPRQNSYRSRYLGQGK